jgi:hypothetical protein
MKVNKNLVANKKALSISEGASLSCVSYLYLQGGPEFIPVYLIYAALGNSLSSCEAQNKCVSA